MLLRVMLRLGFSVVSDAERYPGGNGITSGSIKTTPNPQWTGAGTRDLGGRTVKTMFLNAATGWVLPVLG